MCRTKVMRGSSYFHQGGGGGGGGAVQAQLPETEFLALNLFTEGSRGWETSSWGAAHWLRYQCCCRA